MTPTLDLLNHVRTHIGFPIKLPSGNHVPISHIGSLIFAPSLSLDQNLCVPSFKFNLMLVSKITKALHFSVQFFPKICFLEPMDEEGDWLR